MYKITSAYCSFYSYKFKTREVSISDAQHETIHKKDVILPAVPDYNNPIEFVFTLGQFKGNLKFGTRDGEESVHPGTERDYKW